MANVERGRFLSQKARKGLAIGAAFVGLTILSACESEIVDSGQGFKVVGDTPQERVTALQNTEEMAKAFEVPISSVQTSEYVDKDSIYVKMDNPVNGVAVPEGYKVYNGLYSHGVYYNSKWFSEGQEVDLFTFQADKIKPSERS